MSVTINGVFTNVGDNTLVLTLKDGKATVEKRDIIKAYQSWEVQFFVGGKLAVPLLNKGTNLYLGWDAKFTEAVATNDKDYVWEYGTPAELVGGKVYFEATVATGKIYSLVVDSKTKVLGFVEGKATTDYGKWTLS